MSEASAAAEGSVPPNNLPPHTRLITTHTPDGKSVFDKRIPKAVPIQVLDARSSAAMTYVAAIPTVITDDVDIVYYADLLKDPPGLTVPGTAVLRAYDMAPGIVSPMHRTKSVDYMIVLCGEVELALDSGEKQIIRPGEVVIQRGTMHSWKNVGTEWARMLATTIPIESLVVGGEVKGEELGGIGFKDSK